MSEGHQTVITGGDGQGGESSIADKIKSLLTQLQPDATSAGYRVVGRQLVKLVREPLVAWLTSEMDANDPSLKEKVGAFLETELGEAAVTTALSLAFLTAPESAGEIPKRLARELRIKAMTDVGDVVADVLMGPLRQILVDGIKAVTEQQETLSLPAEGTNRIKAPTERPATIVVDLPVMAANK